YCVQYAYLRFKESFEYFMFKGNHGSNFKKHLKLHNDIYEKYLIKELDKSTDLNVPVKTSNVDLYQFLNLIVKTDMKTLINACVKLVTVHKVCWMILGFKIYKSNSKCKYVDTFTCYNRALFGTNGQYILNNFLDIYLKDTILKVIKKFNIEPQQINTITSDNGANMLKVLSLFEKETLQIPDELNNKIIDDISENDTALDNTVEILNSNNNSDIDEMSNIDPDSNSHTLNKNQISELLSEDIENVGDTSIFTYPTDDHETYLSQINDDKSMSSNFGSLSNSQTETILTKIEILLKSFIIEEKRLSHKTNILQFWKSKNFVYPKFFELSNIIFSVSATQNLTPEIILTDYEAALRDLLISTFPNAGYVGCWFHYNQAVWRKMKNLGYLHHVNRNKNARKTLKLLLALLLLQARVMKS
ncbi:Hypothetical protein CINCED_3A017730, partial [Cinara cedri]